MPKLSAPARARKIRLLLFDVDGVLTDGKLFFLPEKPQPSAGQTAQSQVEFKGFHAHDDRFILWFSRLIEMLEVRIDVV